MKKILLIIALFIFTLVMFILFYANEIINTLTGYNTRSYRYYRSSFEREFAFTNNVEIYPGLRMWAEEIRDKGIIKYNFGTNVTFKNEIKIYFTNILTKPIFIPKTEVHNIYYSLYSTNAVEIKPGNIMVYNQYSHKKPLQLKYPLILRPGIIYELRIPSIEYIYNIDTNKEYVFKLGLWLYDNKKRRYYLSKPIVLSVKNQADDGESRK